MCAVICGTDPVAKISFSFNKALVLSEAVHADIMWFWLGKEKVLVGWQVRLLPGAL